LGKIIPTRFGNVSRQVKAFVEHIKKWPCQKKKEKKRRTGMMGEKNRVLVRGGRKALGDRCGREGGRKKGR